MKRIIISLQRIDQSPIDLSAKLHGFLMEKLDPDYVAWLHEQETNPYSMKVTHQREQTIWTLQLLTDEAIQQILPFVLELKRVELHGLPVFGVQSITMQDLSSEQLFEFFNENQDRSLFTVHFQSPTGFRSQGEYVLFPTMRLIFQSLMMKYARLLENRQDIEEETLDYLVEHSRITSYRLESSYFRVHGKKIPGFKGKLTFKITGPTTLKAYANMLLKFGEYSGIGMKTSLGMGGLELEERKD